MNTATAPDALLLLTSQCPHCPAVLAALADLVKRGEIGRLEVVNLEQHPATAESLGVRSVPWLRVGPFQLTGVRTASELQTWAHRAASPDGMSDAFHDLLKQADLAQVLQLIAAVPARLADLLPIVANPEASLNVKLGVGVVFDEYAGKPVLQDLLSEIARLMQHADARVRADACHLLGLTGSAAAIPMLRAALQDENGDVREIATDGLTILEAHS
jgi:hypothetical protein